MFEKNQILIIFGRSLFIDEISDHIPDLCNKYDTLGINYFCNSFPEVANVMFYDDITPNVLPSHKIITNKKYYDNDNAKCNNLLKNNHCELYKIVKNSEYFSKKQNVLHFCVHTPSMAFNWAWLKGYKNIIIAGIDLMLENRLHFDAKTTPDADSNDFNEGAISAARRHLEKIASRYLNIYQLNLKSDLKIPKIKLEDLL